MHLNQKEISFEHLIKQVAVHPRKCQTLLIGVDGCGASGKTTFAKKMKSLASNITLVQMDDFFLPFAQRLSREAKKEQIGADFDWRRVQTQVLELLRSDKRRLQDLGGLSARYAIVQGFGARWRSGSSNLAR